MLKPGNCHGRREFYEKLLQSIRSRIWLQIRNISAIIFQFKFEFKLEIARQLANRMKSSDTSTTFSTFAKDITVKERLSLCLLFPLFFIFCNKDRYSPAETERYTHSPELTRGREIINETETMEIHFICETIANERGVLILSILVDGEYTSSST